MLCGFLGGSAGKESACSAGDLGLIPGLGRYPGEGKGCPLQYSGLENAEISGRWSHILGVLTKALRPQVLIMAERQVVVRIPWGLRDGLSDCSPIRSSLRLMMWTVSLTYG